MKFKAGWLCLAALGLAACAGSGNKEPSARERAYQISNIKTQLALEYMRGQDYRQAVTSIDEAIAANAKNETAWLMRAQIYQYLKVTDKAQESFQKALSINPASAEINNNYGWFLCSTQNRPNESLAYFDKALADPTYPSPHIANLNKGICSAKMGQYSLSEAFVLLRRLVCHPESARQAYRTAAADGFVGQGLNVPDVEQVVQRGLGGQNRGGQCNQTVNGKTQPEFSRAEEISHDKRINADAGSIAQRPSETLFGGG